MMSCWPTSRRQQKRRRRKLWGGGGGAAIEDVQEGAQLDLSGGLSQKSIAKLWDSKMVSGGPRQADAGSSPFSWQDLGSDSAPTPHSLPRS